MITEDYVSFETAKLLKEKGFNEECRAAYTNYGKLFTTQIQQYITNILCSKGILWDCTAPTFQMAMKWLRKEYKLEIYPFHEKLQGDSWWYRIERSETFVNLTEYEEDLIFGSYEQACEAAIKYCLENLI